MSCASAEHSSSGAPELTERAWFLLLSFSAAFTSTTGSMKDLSDMLKTVRYWFTDSRLLGSFVANHDGPSFPPSTLFFWRADFVLYCSRSSKISNYRYLRESLPLSAFSSCPRATDLPPCPCRVLPQLLANLFAYPFVTDGIPIFYYGDEQSGSVGPSDPENREALWTLGSSPYDVSSTCSPCFLVSF